MFNNKNNHVLKKLISILVYIYHILNLTFCLKYKRIIVELGWHIKFSKIKEIIWLLQLKNLGFRFILLSHIISLCTEQILSKY